MNYFFIILAIVFIVYILRMIKMKNFSIKESIFWVAGTFGILVFSIFPKLLDKIAVKLNIEYPPSLLFLVGIFFLLSGLALRPRSFRIISERRATVWQS